MKKDSLHAVRLTLRFFRWAAVVWFVISSVICLINMSDFGSVSPELAVLIRGIIATVLFVIFLIPELILRKKNKEKDINIVSEGPARKHPVRAALIAAVFVFIALLIGIWFIQDKLLFYPSRYAEVEELLEKSSECKRVSYSSDENIYSGWLWAPGRSDDSVIVYFGGNAQVSSLTIREWMIDNAGSMLSGHKLLYIDYPGYGESNGSPSESSIFKMVDTIMPDVLEKYDSVYIMGFSVGTGPAVYAASKYDTNGLILNAPYDNMTNVFNDNLNVFHGPLKSLVRNRFTSDEYAPFVTEPVLIIGSEDDEVVFFSHTKSLCSCFSDYTLITMSEVGHNDLMMQQKTRKAIQNFLKNN